MAGTDGSEPLAGAIIQQRDAALTTGLLHQADGIFDRFDRFGGALMDPAGALLDGLIDRWALPERLENGLELFDLDVLGELTRSWASRTGYFDAQFGFDGPFVVPVDPEQPVPLDAARVRRGRGRRPASALRPMAPARRARPRPSLAETLSDRWAAPPAPVADEVGFEHFDGAVGATLVEPVAEPGPSPTPDAADRARADRSSSVAAPRGPAAGPPSDPSGDASRPPAGGPPAAEPTLVVPPEASAATTRAGSTARVARDPSPSPRRTASGPASPAESPTAPAIPPAARPSPAPVASGVAAAAAQGFAPSQRDAAVRPAAALARQRWRAVGEGQLTVYPRAMGRAGAIDAGLLRFPEARARLGGAQAAVFAGAPGIDLMRDGGGLAPVSRGAERLVRRVFDTLVPVAEPVAAWLVPILEGRPSSVEAWTRTPDTPIESALAQRTPTAELVVSDAIRPSQSAAPARTTAAARPRLDGRVALPDRVRGASVPSARAPSGVPGATADREVTVRASTDGAAVRGPAVPVVRPIGVPSAPDDSGLPAAVRAALALSHTRGGLDGESPAERAPSMSGARAWLGEALARTLLAPAAASPDRPSGLPGMAGAAARAMAERLAVAVGEPALLADRAQTPAAFRPGALVEPTAGKPSTNRSIDVAVPRRLVEPDAPVAASADGDDVGALRLTSDTFQDPIVDPRVASPDAAGQPAAVQARTLPRADAASWAGRIVERLAVEPGASGTLDAVVDRIAERLAGGTLLAGTLARFEAADSPVERQRAWRAVIDEAGLDPSVAALVEPVADRIVESPSSGDPAPRRETRGPAANSTAPASPSDGASPTAMARSAASPSTAARQAASAGPVAASQASPGSASAARGSAARASSSSSITRPGDIASPSGPGIGAQPVFGPRGRSSGATVRGGRRPGALARVVSTAGSDPELFERRMGLSQATRPAALAEARRWVIDPTGERWLVPLAASTRAAAVTDDSAAQGSPGAISGATARLAERIVSGFVPDAARPMAAATARVLARLAPPAAAAWVASGFDPLALPTAERALLQGVESSQPAQRYVAGGSAARAPTAGAPSATSAVPFRPTAAARPGALGAAMARLAERVVERPALTGRAPARAGRLVEPGVSSPAAVGRAAPSSGTRSSAPSSATASAPVGRASSSRPSSMDPAALVAAGATATESRMPARLRQWSALGDARSAEPSRSAYADGPTPVMVSPGGPGESAGPAGSSVGSDGSLSDGSLSGASLSGASLPGERTVAAALRAFDRARVGNGSKAPAVGRPAASAADVGQLVAAAMIREAPGGRLFGDRGPLAVNPPGPASRVYIETGKRASGDQPLRSTGESAGPRTDTNDDARHRLASQTEGDLSPEELERIADEVISQLRRELEFEGSRFGEDEWD